MYIIICGLFYNIYSTILLRNRFLSDHARNLINKRRHNGQRSRSSRLSLADCQESVQWCKHMLRHVNTTNLCSQHFCTYAKISQDFRQSEEREFPRIWNKSSQPCSGSFQRPHWELWGRKNRRVLDLVGGKFSRRDFKIICMAGRNSVVVK